MTEEFFINQNSVLPVLRMELTMEGRCDFHKQYVAGNALQDAVVTFTMKNAENDRLCISKAPALVKKVKDGTCGEKVILEYDWKERDTREPGKYIGRFEIKFNGDITEAGVDYPKGNLVVPILEDLVIIIK